MIKPYFHEPYGKDKDDRIRYLEYVVNERIPNNICRLEDDLANAKNQLDDYIAELQQLTKRKY